MLYSSPPRLLPSIRENVFLCWGQATLGVPSRSPIKPRARTMSRLWGHPLSTRFHR